LSESINRVIITEGNLRRGSDPMGWKTKDIWTYTRVTLLHGENSGEKTNQTHHGITHLAASIWVLFYKGVSEP
jgi:hypothetical protein